MAPSVRSPVAAAVASASTPAPAVSTAPAALDLDLSLDTHLPPAPAAASPSPTDSVILLDPADIVIPDIPNRESSSFDDESADHLQSSIEAGCGNTIPIGVRLVIEPDGSHRYYLVYGERRVRACRHAGLRVRAIVLPTLSATEHGLQRIRENASRKRLAPIELGRQLAHLLASDARLTQRQLAQHLGRGEDQISKALQLARLDPQILQAFARPQELQYEHRLPLQRAFKEQPQLVAAEAQRIRALPQIPQVQDIVDALVKVAKDAKEASPKGKKQEPKASTQDRLPPERVEPRSLQARHKPFGRLRSLDDGVLEVLITKTLTAEHVAQLGKLIEKFVDEKVIPKDPAVKKGEKEGRDGNEGKDKKSGEPEPALADNAELAPSKSAGEGA